MIRSCTLGLILVIGVMLFIAPLNGARADGFNSLYAFTGHGDGDYPEAGLVTDDSGNIYGTTSGSLDVGTPGKKCSKSCGNVYELVGGSTFNPIYAFQAGATDGAFPAAEVLVLGNEIYGTTEYGTGVGCGGLGCGTMFEMTTDGTKKKIIRFCLLDNCDDGVFPHAGLTLNSTDGQLYGTASLGGKGNGTLCGSSYGGCGTIYKFDRRGAIPVYAFCTNVQNNLCTDGAIPFSKLISDGAGNLYGTTQFGGANAGGTIFKFDTVAGTETVIYSFCSQIQGQICTDGAIPQAGLTFFAGSFYGTATYGGKACQGNPGCGVVFRVAPDGGGYTVLHKFRGGNDGALPTAAVSVDEAGNVYGTTPRGGTGDCTRGKNQIGCGIVFKLTPSGKEKILYTFGSGGDDSGGVRPVGAMVLQGNVLYGVTTNKGDPTCSCGTVYSLSVAAERSKKQR